MAENAPVVDTPTGMPSGATISSVLHEIPRTVGWSSRSLWTFPRQEQGLAVGFSAVDDLRSVLPLCGQRRVCVQAGGAVGIYPLWLVQYFEHVYTFEPNPWLFECLCQNVDQLRVHKFEAALGLGGRQVSLACPEGQAQNQGAWHTREGGCIPEMRLDDLCLPYVDFICLDIEGDEGAALAGAQQTIERCRPVIQVEDKRKIRLLRGLSEDWLNDVCATLDYHIHHQAGPDVVLVPR